MKHYICTGECMGESDKPKVCSAEFCSMKGESFDECKCEDGLHHMEEGGLDDDEMAGMSEETPE